MFLQLRGAVAKLDEANLLKLAGLVAEVPDATLDELRDLLRCRFRIRVSINTVWRGLRQIDFTLKKSLGARVKPAPKNVPRSVKNRKLSP